MHPKHLLYPCLLFYGFMLSCWSCRPSEQQTSTIVFNHTEHYPEKITRDEIAECCGFSPNYLSRLFKSVAGVSLSEHITDIRMQQAMSLFKNTDKCIGDIIESVGYRSPSLFYRHFYSRFGTKPSEARNGKPSHTL